jgi:hypothetical protein
LSFQRAPGYHFLLFAVGQMRHSKESRDTRSIADAGTVRSPVAATFGSPTFQTRRLHAGTYVDFGQ